MMKTQVRCRNYFTAAKAATLKRYGCIGGIVMALAWINGCAQTANSRAAGAPLTVVVAADRPGALYANGEKALFTIDVTRGGKRVTEGEVEVWLSQDGGPGANVQKRFNLAAQPTIQVEGSVAEPAFYLCQAWATVGAERSYGEKVVWYRPPADPSAVTITLAADRADALYHPGEQATFTASVMQNGKPVTDGELQLRLSREGGDATIARETFDLSAGGPMKISGTLGDPSFLYCQARLTRNVGNAQTTTAWTSAGYDVDKITPATPMPQDFEAFWKDTLAKARQLPVDVNLQEIKSLSNAKATYYRFSISTLNDERVYGFLGIPTGPGPFPAVAMYPGLGSGVLKPIDLGLTSRGVITMMMNVHKYEVPDTREEAERLAKQYATEHGATIYASVGANAREAYHFYTVLAGFCRALDYLCARDDWDRKHLVVMGGSQGGFLTMAMAGLNPDKVTLGIASVPGNSDTSRNRDEAERAARAGMVYYDSANFARLVRCPIQVCVGFRDGSCPPPNVLGAYNSIPNKSKKLIMAPSVGHETTPARQAAERECLMRGLGFADGE